MLSLIVFTNDSYGHVWTFHIKWFFITFKLYPNTQQIDYPWGYRYRKDTEHLYQLLTIYQGVHITYFTNIYVFHKQFFNLLGFI